MDQSKLAFKREKKAFLSAKVNKIRTTIETPKKRKREATEEEELDEELSRLTKEVQEFGAAQFVRKKKRDWEEHQFVKLGGKPAKQQKILYTHKMGIDKRKKELEQKKIEVAKETGMYVPKPKKRKEEDFKSFMKARQQFGIGNGERGLKCSIGTYKNGILYVPDLTKDGKGGPGRGNGRGGRGRGSGRGSDRGRGSGRGSDRGRGSGRGSGRGARGRR